MTSGSRNNPAPTCAPPTVQGVDARRFGVGHGACRPWCAHCLRHCLTRLPRPVMRTPAAQKLDAAARRNGDCLSAFRTADYHRHGAYILDNTRCAGLLRCPNLHRLGVWCKAQREAGAQSWGVGTGTRIRFIVLPTACLLGGLAVPCAHRFAGSPDSKGLSFAGGRTSDFRFSARPGWATRITPMSAPTLLREEVQAGQKKPTLRATLAVDHASLRRTNNNYNRAYKLFIRVLSIFLPLNHLPPQPPSPSSTPAAVAAITAAKPNHAGTAPRVLSNKASLPKKPVSN